MNDVVRLARQTDCPAMYAIKIAAHAGSIYQSLIPEESRAKFLRHYTWSPSGEKDFTEYILAKIKDPSVVVNVIERADQVCGYLVAHQDVVAGHWNIDNVFVDPATQGSGVGSTLLDNFLTPEKSVCELRVMAGNHVAIGLYQKYGFKITEKEAGFFYGAPLVRMRRAIDIRII